MMLPSDARIVGIDGRGGSGKSTLGRALAAQHGGVVVELDDFYRPSAERHVPPQTHGGNYDLPRVRAQVLAPFLRRRRLSPSVMRSRGWKNQGLS
jgi:uridine kinase